MTTQRKKKTAYYEEGYQEFEEYVEGPPEKTRIKVTRKLRNRGEISHETLALMIMNIYEYLISVNKQEYQELVIRKILFTPNDPKTAS